jgi:hypothetical protein
MKPLLVMAACLAFASLSGVSVAKQPVRSGFSGIFGNVRMSPNTGDLGGQEIRFFKDEKSGSAMVEYVHCEGWCNATHIVPLYADEAGHWFEYTETLYSGDGAAVPGISYRYNLKYKGKTLILSGRAVSDNGPVIVGPFALKPLRQTFGIDVAHYVP